MDSLTTIKPELLTVTFEQVKLLLPLIILIVGGAVTILLSVVSWLPAAPVAFGSFVLTFLLAIGATVQLMGIDSSVLFNGMFAIDGYSLFFYLLVLLTGLITGVSSFGYLKREELRYPEYFILIIFAALGMMLMVSSLELISLFVSLEMMSIAIYVLVGFRRNDRRSNEAAMKYFILGSVASAILLYGIALLYGATGSTNVRTVLGYMQTHPEAYGTYYVLGAWLAIVGFLFKVAAVPFHMWMPDVYEGAPTPITGFMTTGLKAAAFAAFIRVLLAAGHGQAFVGQTLHHLLWLAAVLTMVVGNLIALTQTNLKRMLAYSSISHTGYLLVGLLVAPKSEQGLAPVLMYLVAYSIMNLGAFILLAIISKKKDLGITIYDVAGLAKSRPWIAFGFSVFLFSMAGIPPTVGFAAKYLLFYSGVQANEILLVVISVLCSAISVYYYLRVMVFMYMRDPAEVDAQSSTEAFELSGVSLASLSASALVFATLGVGLIPAPLVEAAKKAISTL